MFKFLTEYRRHWEGKSVLSDTAEDTFRQAAFKEGVLTGLDALLEMDVDD